MAAKQDSVISKVIKRDGSVAEFDQEKITSAVFRAADAVGGDDRKTAEKLSKMVVLILEKRFTEKMPNVEDVQNIVEEVLIKEGHAKTAKAYILYRAKRAELRAAAAEAAKGSDDEKAALLHMFAHKSKLASLIGYDRLEAYKNLLFHLKALQKSGKLPVNGNYLNGNELATNIYQRKYFLKDLDGKHIETKPEDTFARLAAFMAAVENGEETQKEWAERFYLSLYNGHFLPGGRVIAGAGDLYRLKTLANCFVSLIEDDNIESIYKAAYECARTYSYGGGIGVDLSVLRPKDAIVHNAADCSTGSVSFMEIFSLTTGLIGQSGRRGALMLTIDVKHPDSPLFINVKKIPNWVTKQVVQQCEWAGSFTKEQLSVIEQQVRENTQVRFANISLKVSDEFMQAVEEQNNYQSKILVYSKDSEVPSFGVPQGGSVHYSYAIPSKPIEKYKLIKVFETIGELNQFLEKNGAVKIMEEQLSDSAARDMFGDLIVKAQSSEYDFAIKRAGDFMLYFNSPHTKEIKRLVKAREIWNSFVEGNYKTAEPGLIFWSTMTKYSPSNYVGRPIVSTNPCVAADTRIETDKGLMTMKELSEKYGEGGVNIAVDARMLPSDNLMLCGKLFLPMKAAMKTGKKHTIKIKTEKGLELVCTPDHKVMTNCEWVEASKLTKNHKVFINNNGEEAILDSVAEIVSNGLEDVYDLQEPLTHSFIANGFVVHNCGEVPLEDGGACNLASLNPSRFVTEGYTKNAKIDWKGLKEAVSLIVRFLDNVVIWNELLNPLEKQRKASQESRRVGLGVMGVADMLNQLGLGYDSEEAMRICEETARTIANTAYMASADISEEKGPSSIFDYEAYSKGAFFREALDEETKAAIRSKGLRNIALLSIAPTGTISSIVLGYSIGEKNFIGASGGIEPVFALFYTRRSESFENKIFKVFHSTVDAYLQETGMAEKAHNCMTAEELKEILPKNFFRTAHYIDPEQRVKIQGIWQKYIDHSISSTINLSEDVNPEVISNIYLDAWKYGLKGITIYRAGSRYPILSSETEKSEFQQYKDKLFETEVDGKKMTVKGGDVITLSDGKLTTVYHAMKEKKITVRSEKQQTTLIAE